MARFPISNLAIARDLVCDHGFTLLGPGERAAVECHCNACSDVDCCGGCWCFPRPRWAKRALLLAPPPDMSGRAAKRVVARAVIAAKEVKRAR